MYPDDYDPDPTTCPGCGCELEVIGPPGPVHAKGCAYDDTPVQRPPTVDELEETASDPFCRQVIEAGLVDLSATELHFFRKKGWRV